MAKAYFGLDEHQNAYWAIKKEIEIVPDCVDNYFLLGDICKTCLNKAEEGFDAYTKGLRAAGLTDNPEEFLQLVFTDMKTDESIPNRIEEVIFEGEYKPRVLFAIGDILYRNKDFDKSIQFFTWGLRRASPMKNIYMKLGMAYNFLKRYDEAYDALSKETLYFDDNAQAYFFLGNLCLNRLKKFDESIEHYSMCLLLDFIRQNLFFNLGRAYFTLGEMNRALDCFLNELHYFPNSPKRADILGYIFFISRKLKPSRNHRGNVCV